MAVEALRFDATVNANTRDLGKMANALGDVRDELQKLDRTKAQPEVDVKTDKAQRDIERFAAQMRKKLDSAFKNLPDIQINADSSDVDRELAQVKKDIASLRDAKIGIDVDAATAEARLRELRATLTRLNAESVDIKVKTDTLAAVKALGAIKLDAVELPVSTAKAERQVGAFAADLQKKLSAAAKALPEIELTADSSDVDRDVARIGNELRALADQRIGIDVDAAQAEAEVARLESELRALSGRDLTVQARADVAAALAGLASVNREADKLDGKKSTVKVDVDKSLSDSIVKVAALGRALGMLAVPAAALAAAPQIAAIGAASVSAVGALGLLPAALGAVGLAQATVTAGFGDLTVALTGTEKKAQEAYDKLSKSGKQMVDTIKSFAPAWDSVKGAVQTVIFAPLIDDVKKLGETYLPILSKGMINTATAIGKTGQSLSAVFQQSSRIADIRVIVDNSATAWKNLLAAVTPIVGAFTDIARVGSSFLPQLTAGVGAAATRFQEFVARARESGQLAAWIQQGITAVQQLGSITGNVGSILLSVFRSATSEGANLLQRLDEITGKAADFLKSAAGQSALTSLFSEIRDGIDAAMPGLEALGRVVVEIIQKLGDANVLQKAGQAFTAIAEAAAPVLSVLGDIAATVLPPLLDLVKLLAPALVPVAVGILAIKAATAGFAAAQKFPQWLMSAKDQALGAEGRMTALGRAVDAVKTPFTAAGESARRFGDQMKVQQSLAAASGKEVGKLGAATGVLAQRLQEPIAAVRQFGSEVSGSYTRANTAVTSFADGAGKSANIATVALGDKLAGGAQKGVDGVLKLGSAAKDAGGTLKTGLGVAAIDTAQSLAKLPSTVSAVASSMKTGLGVAAIDAAQSIRQLPTAATSAASTLKTGLGVAAIDAGQKVQSMATAATAAGQSMATGLKSGVTAASDAIRTLPTVAAEAGRTLASGLQSGATAASTAVRSLATTTAEAGRSLATGLQTGVTAASTAVRGLATSTADAGRAMATNLQSGVTSAVSAVRQLPSAAADAGRSLATGLQSGVTSAVSTLRQLPTAAADATRSLGSSVTSGVQAAGNALRTGMQTGVTAAGESLRSLASTAGSAATATATAIGNGLRAIPGTVQSAFSTVGAAVQTGVTALGRFSGAVAGVASAVGTTLKKAVVGASDALGGQFGVSLAAATLALGAAQQGIQKGTDAFMAGGKAQREYTAGADTLGERLKTNIVAFLSFGTAADMTRTLDATAASTKKLYDAMTPLQQAQTDATRAFNDYQDALSRGDTAAAAEALGRYQDALKRVESVNQLANTAAKDYNATLRDQVGAAQTALGANVALDDALARVVEAQTRANTAAAEHGAKSKEAADANRELVQAVDQAAQAASRKAQADAAGLGPQEAANQGAAAYASTLLSQAATLKGPARDAVLSYLGSLSQVQLDALSAAAATSGFSTEVIKLPNGKTVKVAVDPETGKIVDTARQLDAIKSRTVMISVNGSAAPAQKVIADIVAAINAGQGTIQINGNPVPVQQAVTALLANINTQRGTVTLDGNPTLVNGKVTQAVTFADGSRGTIQINGNPDPATGTVTATVTYANGQTGIIQLGADPTSANATVAGVKTSASAQVTFPLASDPSSAQGSVSGVQGTARTPQSFPTGSDTGSAQGSVTAVQGIARIAQMFGLGADPASAAGTISSTQATARAPQTMPMDANPGAAQGKVSSTQATARQQQTMPVDANPGAAQGKVNAVQGSSRQTQRFAIDADPGPAQRVWDALKRTFSNITTTITTIYRTITQGAAGMVYPANAYADGGAGGMGGQPMTVAATPSGMVAPNGRRLTRGNSDVASVAPPNSWRVFGDRPDVDEFFLPDNNAPRTMALGSEWANRRGMMLVPARKMAAGGKIQAEDGSYVNPDFYSKVSPKYAAAAGMVQAEDGSYVNPGFYSKVSPQYAAAQGAGQTGGIVAEDGSTVNPNFYAKTSGMDSFGGIAVGLQVMANGGVVPRQGSTFTLALAKAGWFQHEDGSYSNVNEAKWAAPELAQWRTQTQAKAIAQAAKNVTIPNADQQARASGTQATRQATTSATRAASTPQGGQTGSGACAVDVSAIVAGLRELKQALGRPNVSVTNNNPIRERGSDSTARTMRTLSSMGLFGGDV